MYFVPSIGIGVKWQRPPYGVVDLILQAARMQIMTRVNQ
jgi:hypothetical protein